MQPKITKCVIVRRRVGRCESFGGVLERCRQDMKKGRRKELGGADSSWRLWGAKWTRQRRCAKFSQKCAQSEAKSMLDVKPLCEIFTKMCSE